MDATGMVKMALKWKNVGTQVQSAVKASIGSVTIPASSSRSAKMEVTVHGTEQDPDKVALPGSSPSPSPSPSPPAPAQSPTPSPSPAKVRPSVSPVEAAVVPAVSGGSSASLVSVDNCYDQSEEGLCRACKVGFRTLGGRCVKQCPSQGYYEGVANSSTACLSCYSSCQTCHGPNDYECLTCYGDAELDTTSSIGKYCHNKNLVSTPPPVLGNIATTKTS